MTDKSKKSKKLKCLLKGKNKLTCVLCSLFIESADVMKHLLSHVGAVPFFCVICKETFLSESHFKNHKSEHLQKSSTTTVSIYPCIHQCNICDLALPSSYKHILHYFDHLLQLNIKCIICNLYFSNFEDFSIHQHLHEHNFSCQICGYTEREKQLLLHHVVQHSSNKFFQNFFPTYFSKSSEDSYNLKTNDYLLNRKRESMNSANPEIEREKLSKKLCTSGTNDSSLNDGMKTSKTNICISQKIKPPLNSCSSETQTVLGGKVSNFHDKMEKGNEASEFNISVSKQIKSPMTSNSSKTPVLLSGNNLHPEIVSFTHDISLANTATYTCFPYVVRLTSDNNDSLQKLASSLPIKATNDSNSHCDGFQNCVMLGTKSNVSFEINNKTSQTLSLIHNEHICRPDNNLTLNLEKIFNHSETIKEEEEPIEINNQVINDCCVSGHSKLNNQNCVASSQNVEQDSGLVKVKLEFEAEDVSDSQELNSTSSHFSDPYMKETGENLNLYANGQEEVLTNSEIPCENSEICITVDGKKEILTDSASPFQNSEINATVDSHNDLTVGGRKDLSGGGLKDLYGGGQKVVLTDSAIYNRDSKMKVREEIETTNNISKKLQPGSVVLRKLASHRRYSTLIHDETLQKISRIDLPVIDETNCFIQKLQPCSVVLRKLNLSQDCMNLSTSVPNQNLDITSKWCAHANDNKLNNPLKQKSVVSHKLSQDSINILSSVPNQNSDRYSSKELAFAKDANKLCKRSVVSNKLSQDSLNAQTFQNSRVDFKKDISAENHANLLNKQCLVVLEKLPLSFNDIVQRSSALDISMENDINVLNKKQCSVVLHKFDPCNQDFINVPNFSFHDSFEGSSRTNVTLANDNMANKKLKQCSVVLHKLPSSVLNFDSYLICSKSVNCTPVTYEEMSKKKFGKFLKRLKKKFKKDKHAQTLIKSIRKTKYKKVKSIRKTKYKKVNSKRSKKLNKNLCQLCDIVYDKYKFKKFKYLKINSVKNSNSSRLFNDANSSTFEKFQVKKIETRIKSIRNFLKSQEKTV